MSNTAANMIIGLAIVAVLAGGGAALQIFLSKREAKWPGLVLPIITLLVSLVAVSGVAVYRSVGGGTEPINANAAAAVFTIIYVFAVCNIPTAVLTAIYAACRGKLKRRRAQDRMAAQDLE